MVAYIFIKFLERRQEDEIEQSGSKRSPNLICS
jgi:hypothetical protein